MIRQTAVLLTAITVTGGTGACAPQCTPAPLGDGAAVDTGGAQPATGRRPSGLSGFYGYAVVEPDDYRAYVTDRSGAARAVLFATAAGVRCQIGPNSHRNRAGTTCWGALPGVAPDVNVAVATTEPTDRATHAPATAESAPPDTVFAYLGHADDLGAREAALSSDGSPAAIPAAGYRLLGPGQMIVVPGERFSRAAESVCALDPDGALTCEIQTADGPPSGFVLSAAGSRAY